MVGIKRFKIILGIFIPIFCFFLMSHNTSAVNMDFYSYAWYFRNSGESPTWSSEWTQTGGPHNAGYKLELGPNSNLAWIRFTTDNVSATGNYAAVNFKFNVVAAYPINYTKRWTWDQNINVGWILLNGTQYTPKNASVSSVVTDWDEYNGSAYCNQSMPCHMSTLTIMGSFYLENVQHTTGPVVLAIGNSGGFWKSDSDQYNSTKLYLESYSSSIDFTESIDNSLLQYQISQNNTIIQQNQQMINDSNAYYDKQDAAVNNIDNQSSSDISGAENSQTTSLINVISGFISAFSGISSTNCNLTLDFPSYAGGTRQVNICSGKEKAPRIVEIGSSLLLIVFFVPLAYILIKMIYNEIRSWTNG